MILLSIVYQLKPVLDLNNRLGVSIPLFMTELKLKLIVYLMLDWISNIVPVEKKDSGKIRVCIDFRDLNKATPKDEYPMPIADMLINEASGHRVISFLMVTPVTIKYSWPKKMYLKRPLDVRDLLAYLSGWL